MTEGTPPNRPAAAQPRPAGRRSVAPELVAAALSAAVIVALSAGLLSAGSPPRTEQPGSSATPSATARPDATPAIDDAAIDALLEIDSRLAADRVSLQAELSGRSVDAGRVAGILRSVNADLIAAAIPAGRLERQAISAAVGTRLATFYSDLQKVIANALVNSVNNTPAYVAAANATIKALAELPALDALLTSLRAVRPSPPASPSTAPSGPARSSPPSASIAPTPAPTTNPSAGASPAGPNAIIDPGFEAGAGPPWELVVSGTGSATLTADAAVHETGASSARIDITDAGVERAAVALRQGGLSIVAGSRYVGSIAVRAASPREVRLRIASAAGDTYATRLFTVGTDWQVLTIDSTVFATDLDAYLEVDLGRFAVTTWLDDASFSQLAAIGG